MSRAINCVVKVKSSRTLTIITKMLWVKINKDYNCCNPYSADRTGLRLAQYLIEKESLNFLLDFLLDQI